ncbi:hypothetical protein Bbelb_201640 [Branchiostoma belcheri]|nr:hypothetical protein Bbelb_201640 [Branchiostoma belcheri]
MCLFGGSVEMISSELTGRLVQPGRGYTSGSVASPRLRRDPTTRVIDGRGPPSEGEIDSLRSVSVTGYFIPYAWIVAPTSHSVQTLGTVITARATGCHRATPPRRKSPQRQSKRLPRRLKTAWELEEHVRHAVLSARKSKADFCLPILSTEVQRAGARQPPPEIPSDKKKSREDGYWSRSLLTGWFTVSVQGTEGFL